VRLILSEGRRSIVAVHFVARTLRRSELAVRVTAKQRDPTVGRYGERAVPCTGGLEWSPIVAAPHVTGE
jgi:hypothetical protein